MGASAKQTIPCRRPGVTYEMRLFAKIGPAKITPLGSVTKAYSCNRDSLLSRLRPITVEHLLGAFRLPSASCLRKG